ncbi:MAG: rRNA pseudouridine synthase [Proteobacteria bacterium]|nr:rRNA pseudouridine synthase [Pseudomonadota bacterium]HQR04313.1 pseudouridine synthase [Rhodocyclaceae bacterium]
MKLVRHLANLGYGSRRQVTAMLHDGRVTRADGTPLYPEDPVGHDEIRIDDQPLDPPSGLVLMLHKPVGYTCSTRDTGRLIYELLPSRFAARKPMLSTVGRLDRETSGLLLLTDDGQLLHRIISPKSHLPKVYEAELAADLQGHEAGLFASGTLVLETETTPLAPAGLEVLAPRRVRLTVTEGRYHQVRRMFAAAGNHVITLHRQKIGGLELGNLPAGQWRVLQASEPAEIFGSSC